MNQSNLQALPGIPASSVLEATGDDRIRAMQDMGAQNVRPPLPHSSHVRSRFNGIIFPWTPDLAEQSSLFECCDATGNTSPDAWLPTVQSDIPADIEDREALMDRDRAAIIAQASQAQKYYEQETIPASEQKPDGGFPEGVFSYGDVSLVTEDSMTRLVAMVKE